MRCERDQVPQLPFSMCSVAGGTHSQAVSGRCVKQYAALLQRSRRSILTPCHHMLVAYMQATVALVLPSQRAAGGNAKAASQAASAPKSAFRDRVWGRTWGRDEMFGSH